MKGRDRQSIQSQCGVNGFGHRQILQARPGGIRLQADLRSYSDSSRRNFSSAPPL
jgi:hypothetical protein